MENKLHKRYGLITAIAMVVGIVIGSGVFFKAQVVLQKTGGDMPLGILAWLIGGIIMIVCMLAFAIMASRYEKVNGIVDYAEAIVGEKYAYAIGWFMTTIYYPALTSVLAWLTARYTLTFVHAAAPGAGMIASGDPVTGPECFVLMMFFLCLSFGINALSPKIAGKVQVSTTVIKLIPLILMAVGGIIYGLSTGMTVENFTHVASEAAGGIVKNPLFAAVCATSFAYDGWIIATSINSELKNSKRNLPIALVLGGVIIVVVYIAYYIGVAGGASNTELIENGATSAFFNVFGSVVGTILSVFVAISCFGTLNGLMLACCRGMYSLAVRDLGPRPDVFGQVDKSTNMPNNSAIIGLLFCGFWGTYFYGANLTASWFGPIAFDSSELAILTLYSMYVPIFILFMKKSTDLKFGKRFLIPGAAICGSVFMVIAAIYGHGMACVYYLIVFTVIMLIGIPFYKIGEKRLRGEDK